MDRDSFEYIADDMAASALRGIGYGFLLGMCVGALVTYVIMSW